MVVTNSVTPKAVAKRELLFNKSSTALTNKSKVENIAVSGEVIYVQKYLTNSFHPGLIFVFKTFLRFN
jgi:hypothetical protein